MEEDEAKYQAAKTNLDRSGMKGEDLNWGNSAIVLGFDYPMFERFKEEMSVFKREEQAKILEKIHPYFYDKTGCFWLWEKELFKWERVDDVDILNWINETQGVGIIKGSERTEILNSLKQEGRKNIPLPIKLTWIQFKDKIYDIQTGESFIATPKYFVTNPISYEVSETPETPTMDKIFKEWVGKDHTRILYEILAYCLIPDYPIHRLFCFIGEGMNGKSCYLRLLKKFVGETNVTSSELDRILTSRFEVTKLYKKLVCQMGETNFNEISHTSMLKKLTGQDMVGFEYKNKTPFDETNYAKIIIATNNLPTTADKTIGFYRRWLIIDFPNRFSEDKNILRDIPEEEYNNLATKCLIILKGLLEKRSFTNEGTVEDRMKRYEAKSDFLKEFIKKSTFEDLNSFITKSSFNKRFKEWCKENRHREMSETSIGLSMKKSGFESSRKHLDWFKDGKQVQARVWEGIKWRE